MESASGGPSAVGRPKRQTNVGSDPYLSVVFAQSRTNLALSPLRVTTGTIKNMQRECLNWHRGVTMQSPELLLYGRASVDEHSVAVFALLWRL